MTYCQHPLEVGLDTRGLFGFFKLPIDFLVVPVVKKTDSKVYHLNHF